ncbi:hypothetical protein ACET3X_001734 [Alternaria dauci]|uniref:RING-type domain-containing protein n=1 Tax=Alternaria dauci TaxID=48095 RepID=A0ABR3UYI5_9PLEO
MTVFGSKQDFNSLGLEKFRQSHAHASQDCTICLRPLAVHPTKDGIPDPKCHEAVRISACGHIIGKICLDAWLDVGHTCPACNRLLFEAAGDPITQADVTSILRLLGPYFDEDVILAVIARLVVRQEQECARMRQAHEIEMERIKAEEMEANNDRFALSEEDFLDSGDELDSDEVDDDKESELGEEDNDDFGEKERDAGST